MANASGRLAEVLKDDEARLLDDWVRRQVDAGTARPDLINEADLREQSRAFIAAFRRAIEAGAGSDIRSGHWNETRDVLERLSVARAERGFTPSETATFVFSLKEPLFAALRHALGDDSEAFASGLLQASSMLDALGLYTMETYQRGRETIIQRQQRELLELSTPVVRLWDDILALPLVGTLDSARTQIVMESLLQMIVDTGSAIAIIDITGVPTVDTLVAQHLLKTVAATRLMGADCIISGIRPQIAQTIVHLGVDLGEVTTKATLADAFAVALERTGSAVSSARPA
jgi:rsbT co-antagonist protein RsbR